MTLREQVQIVLDSMSYKPGWSFTLMPEDPRRSPANPPDFLHILCRTRQPSVFPPHQQVFLSQYMVVSPLMLECSLNLNASLKHMLYRTILEMEKHEIDEWLKFNGVCFHEPHPEKEQKT